MRGTLCDWHLTAGVFSPDTNYTESLQLQGDWGSVRRSGTNSPKIFAIGAVALAAGTSAPLLAS